MTEQTIKLKTHASFVFTNERMGGTRPELSRKAMNYKRQSDGNVGVLCMYQDDVVAFIPTGVSEEELAGKETGLDRRHDSCG